MSCAPMGGSEALLSAASNQPIPTPREPAPNQAVKTAGGDYPAGRTESYVISGARALCACLDAGESKLPGRRPDRAGA